MNLKSNILKDVFIRLYMYIAVQSHVMAGLGFCKQGIKTSCSFILIVITCSVAVGSGDKVLPTLLTLLAALTLGLVAVVCGV